MPARLSAAQASGSSPATAGVRTSGKPAGPTSSRTRSAAGTTAERRPVRAIFFGTGLSVTSCLRREGYQGSGQVLVAGALDLTPRGPGPPGRVETALTPVA